MANLFDEEILKPKEKEKKKIKSSTIIIIAIILLTILCILAIVAIVYIKGTILTITIDEQNGKDLEQILIMQENDKVYMPIRRMAEYLGYSSYNGDYITRSEDETKCYIESEEELVSFTLNSNIITKVINGQTQQLKITEPVTEINGELCINSEGAEIAFNFKFYYNVTEKDMTIHTLAYLYQWYSQEAVNMGYLPIEEETYDNKTAVLDNMLIVKSQNNYYGVISIQTAETILEAKYDSIQYMPTTSEFLVESDNKKGIISKEKETKIELKYDNIEKVTNKNDIFYVVKQSNLYGLLDVNGETIIYPEYEQIGIDVSSYSQNGVTNGHILYNQLIPVKSNNKWGLYDMNGKRVTDFIFDSFGSPSNGYREYGVLEVLDYNLIVVCQAGKYNLITLEGKNIFNSYILDSVYLTVSEGKNIYYVKTGTQTTELISFLEENEERLGIQKVEV